MKRRLWILLIVMTFFVSGCASLLPSTRTDTGSRWKTFDQAKQAFDKIVPYQTTSHDLNLLGFGPSSASNVRILTYLDVIQRFMPNPSVTEEDIAKSVRECIIAKDECLAHEFTLKEMKMERYGSVILDLFHFTRKTRTSGWEFQPLIVMNNGLVVYKMWSGRPNINETVEQRKPLGPFQNSGDFLTKLAKDLL